MPLEGDHSTSAVGVTRSVYISICRRSSGGRSNGYTQTYSTGQTNRKHSWLGLPPATGAFLRKLHRRIAQGESIPSETHHDVKQTWCSTVQHAEVHQRNADVYSQLDVNLDFVHPPSQSTGCEFAQMALDLFRTIAPELLPVEETIEFGVDLVCNIQGSVKSLGKGGKGKGE